MKIRTKYKFTIIFICLAFAASVLCGCDVGGMMNSFTGREDVFYNSVQIGKTISFDVDETGATYYIRVGRKDGSRYKLKAIVRDPDGKMVASAVDSSARRIRNMEFIADQPGRYKLGINWNFNGTKGIGYATVDIQKAINKATD